MRTLIVSCKCVVWWESRSKLMKRWREFSLLISRRKSQTRVYEKILLNFIAEITSSLWIVSLTGRREVFFVLFFFFCRSRKYSFFYKSLPTCQWMFAVDALNYCFLGNSLTFFLKKILNIVSGGLLHLEEELLRLTFALGQRAEYQSCWWW